MTISLSGQTVVVTGGARRLGRAIAIECARAGADVAISYRHSPTEAHQTVRDLQRIAPQSRFAAYPLDVANGAEVTDFVAQIERELGGATALVNNAAIFERTPVSSWSETGEAAFDAHIGANLKGPYLLSQRFARLFLQNEGGGHIVNFADIHATRPLANYLPYCISKAGVVMLTQSMAKALAPRVRVNCICPGTILLPVGDASDAMGDEAELVARIPFGRTGTALEIAQTTVFLLGGPAFITGAIVPVDGGESLR